MLELLIAAPGKVGVVLPTTKGPGPQDLKAWYIDPNDSTQVTGYFGDIAAASFIPSYHLVNLVNGSATLGTINTNVVNWMKVYIDGKILFIPQKPVSYNLAMNAIYQLGLMYGTGTNGTVSAFYSPKVMQYKEILYDGFRYSVRLLTGVPVEETLIHDFNNAESDISASEWSRLMYNLCSDPLAEPYRQGPVYKSVPKSELIVANGVGDFDVVANTLRYNNNAWPALRVTSDSVTRITYSGDATYVDSRHCWRPVLELVGVA